MIEPLSQQIQHAISPKQYALSVALCAIFGIVGLHWFYIGRSRYGLFDLGLSMLALVLLFSGHLVIGLILLLLDWIHSLVVTFRLLTGLEVDGEGRRIIYPGQKMDGIVRKKPFA